MDLQKFAESIQRANKVDWKKDILAFVGFIGFDFCMVLISVNNNLLVSLISLCILFVTALEVGRYQWNRYLYFINDDIFLSRKSLSEVARLQAFPVEEYFAYVNKKMVKPAVFLGICSALIGILGGFIGDDNSFAWGRYAIILCFALINAFCPYLIGIWKMKFWDYQSRMGSKGKLNIVHMVCGKLFAVVEVLFVICVTIVSSIIIWAIISQMISPHIDDSIVLLRSYPYAYSFILIILAEIVTLLALVFCHRFSKIVGGISIAIFTAALIALVVEAHIYADITKEQITVCRVWKTKTYDLNDVTSFVIYNERDDIQMKIYFDDGSFAKMSGSAQTSSKKYEKNYDSEYNFIADYIPKLQEAGVSGEIKDVTKLQEDVTELAPQAKSGLDQIIELMK